MDRACLAFNRIKQRARRYPCRILMVTASLLGVCLVPVILQQSRPARYPGYTETALNYESPRLQAGHRDSYTRGHEDIASEQELVLSSSGLVNIIEEHHEVLLYWYNAVETGTLPKQGNTLLHIDGHSDAAPSTSWFNMPLYRLPRNQRELRLMMEENDEFIQVAAATGLINRFIWVWPHFDWGGHTRNMSHVTIHVSAGVMNRKGGKKEEQYVLERCVCAESRHLFLANECVWIEDGDNRDYNSIDESACLDRNLHGTIEFVSTRKAIELAKTGRWMNSLESVILDIDEDFFACEAASVGLYKSGLRSKDISLISYYVGQILCVDNAVDELTADVFFSKLIKTILKIRHNCRNRSVVTERMCLSSLAMGTGVVEQTVHLLDDFDHVMCLQIETTLFMLRKLVNRLIRHINKQLHELMSVGVCMPESPRGTHFHMTEGMVLCTGYNSPNSTWVTTHTLAPGELEQTTRDLEEILYRSQRPKLVTLVRSTRDGYTPRYVSQDIERNVLDVLKRVYPDHVTDDAIHYDAQLLGGPNGWYTRHRK